MGERAQLLPGLARHPVWIGPMRSVPFMHPDEVSRAERKISSLVFPLPSSVESILRFPLLSIEVHLEELDLAARPSQALRSQTEDDDWDRYPRA